VILAIPSNIFPVRAIVGARGKSFIIYCGKGHRCELVIFWFFDADWEAISFLNLSLSHFPGQTLLFLIFFDLINRP
jgi:hypothetical protein